MIDWVSIYAQSMTTLALSCPFYFVVAGRASSVRAFTYTPCWLPPTCYRCFSFVRRNATFGQRRRDSRPRLVWFCFQGPWWASWGWSLWFLSIPFWRRRGSYLAIFPWSNWKSSFYLAIGTEAVCRQAYSRSHQLTKCRLIFYSLSCVILLGQHMLVFHNSPSFFRSAPQFLKDRNQ